jgi:5-methyltetrahydropteroyltriglutamate--homocysteine methyltransferase
VYPDVEEFWNDFIAAYRAEITDLINAGCTYLQFDEVAFAYLCDEEIRGRVREMGEDPDRLISKYVDVLNAITTGWPETLSISLHTCRGNFRGMWRASGAYDAVAERVFGAAEVTGLFLEYDTERAGGFEPLRYVRKGTRVALGLISTKVPKLESKDDVMRRIEEATRFVPIENLSLCPQCGFSSSHLPNPATSEDIQWKKIALLVQTAEEIWGTA